MRATVAKWHAKTLRGADHDISIEFTGRNQQGQRQQICGDDEGCMLGVGDIDISAQIVNAAAGAGVLRQHCEVVGGQGVCPFLGRIGQHNLNPKWRGACLDHFNRLRMAVTRYDEDIRFAFDGSFGQRHRFGGRGGFIQHRRVGDGHGGEVADHRLEVDQRLQPTLRDFSLVGRVGGVPGGVFKNIAQDHTGRVRAVVALANKVFEDLIFSRHGFELSQRRSFRNRIRNCHRPCAGNAARHDAVYQLAPRCGANGLEHDGLIGIINSNVPRDEFRRVFQLGEGFGGVHQHGGTRIKPQKNWRNGSRPSRLPIQTGCSV